MFVQDKVDTARLQGPDCLSIVEPKFASTHWSKHIGQTRLDRVPTTEQCETGQQ